MGNRNGELGSPTIPATPEMPARARMKDLASLVQNDQFVEKLAQVLKSYMRINEEVVIGRDRTRDEYQEVLSLIKTKVIPLIWQGYPHNPTKRPGHDLLSDTDKPQVANEEIEGHNVLSESHHAQIIDSLIFGHNALYASDSPDIQNTLIFGHNALTGRSKRWRKNTDGKTTRNVHIDNSVIIGFNALQYAEVGVIKNSVIMGYAPLLKASNIELENTVVITPKEIFLVGREAVVLRNGLEGLQPIKKTPVS